MIYYNPNNRSNVIQARVDIKEMQEVLAKALIYSKGNVSKYVRLACLEYRPLKKVRVG